MNKPDQPSEKKRNPLVSVIIPTYKRPKKLQRAIESVVEQTYKNWELIVVNDHPECDVRDRLPDHDAIRYVHHDDNQGAPTARNNGIKRSEGKFVAFLDDDDEWDSKKIEQQVAVFNNSYDSLGVVYTGTEVRRCNNRTYNSANKKDNLTKKLLKENFVGTLSSVLVRRSIIEQVGGFDIRFPSWQDKEWYIRLSQYCEFKPVNKYLTIRHMTGDDHISDDFEQLSENTYPLFINKFGNLARSFGYRYYRQWRSICAQNVSGYALRLNHATEARAYATRAIFWYPFQHQSYINIVKSLYME